LDIQDPGMSVTTVPAVPATASAIWSSAAMTASAPPASTKRQAASTFGAIDPLAKWPAAASRRRSATVTAPPRRARGGPAAAPAALAAVLPDLAVRHHELRLVGGQVPTDRLGRVGEPRVGRVDQGARDERRDRVAHPRLQGVHEDEADRALDLRAAPVQRHRWHDARGQLVLDQQVA